MPAGPGPSSDAQEEQLVRARSQAQLEIAKARVRALQTAVETQQQQLKHLINLLKPLAYKFNPTHTRPNQQHHTKRNPPSRTKKHTQRLRARRDALIKELEIEECALQLAIQASRMSSQHPRALQKPRDESSASSTKIGDDVRSLTHVQSHATRTDRMQENIITSTIKEEGQSAAPPIKDQIEATIRESRQMWRKEKHRQYKRNSRLAMSRKNRAEHDTTIALDNMRAKVEEASMRSKHEILKLAEQQRSSNSLLLSKQQIHLERLTQALSVHEEKASHTRKLSSSAELRDELEASRIFTSSSHQGANRLDTISFSPGEKAAAILIAASKKKLRGL